MSSLFESYAVWLADFYLLATILLALVLAAAAILKQPAQRLMVTKSTLAALVLLAILCALPGWSVVHLFTADQPPTPAESVREEPMDPQDSRPYLSQANPILRAEQSSTISPSSDRFLPKPTKPKMGWAASLAAAHLAGIACLLFWLALGWIASARLRQTAQPAPASVSAILNELAKPANPASNRLRLLTHDRIDVAVALGVWQPMILLPARWTNTQSHDHLRSVLAHESTHILNHDLQWVALARVLLIPLWANPLFWLTKRRLRLDQEALADATAAEITSRQQYAEQLVAWARDTRSRPALHLSSAVGLWESPSQLRQRITILLDDQLTVLRNCSRRWRLASVAACGIAAVILSLITLQPAARVEADGKAVAESKSGPVLKGHVTDESGEPISDVTVVLYGGVATRFRGQETKTDAAGNYEFKPLSTGATMFPHPGKSEWYTGVQFKHPEFVPADGKSWRDITVPRERDHEEVLDLKMTRGGKIHGTVVDPESKKPVPNLDLRIYNGFLHEDSGDFRVYAKTDANGEFTSEPLFPGRYVIGINNNNYRGEYRYPSIGSADALAGKTISLQLNDHLVGDLGPVSRTEPATLLPVGIQTTSAEGSAPASDGAVDQRLPSDPLATVAQEPSDSHLTPNTITGRAVDEKGQPIAAAEVLIFRVDSRETTGKRIVQTKTNDNGEYRFDNVIDIKKEFPDNNFPPPITYNNEGIHGIVRKPGRATYCWLTSPGHIAEHGFSTTATMPPAATLTGRVWGPDGTPVVGALVSQVRGLGDWEGIDSARTDSAGNFKLEGLQPFSLAAYHDQLDEQRKRSADGNILFAAPSMLVVEAPGLTTKEIPAQAIPGQQDVQLDRPAIIEGRVVFEENGRDAGNVVVQAVATLTAETSRDYSSGRYFPAKAVVRTDSDGNYRFTTLPPGSYSVSAAAPDWATNGIPTTESTTEKPTQLPDIVFTKGGIVAVRVVDAHTSKPIKLAPRTRAMLIAGSASRPPAGQETIDHFVAPNAQDRFELRVPAGKRSVLAGALTSSQGEALAIGRQRVEVDVVAGQTVEIDASVESVSPSTSTKPVPATDAQSSPKAAVPPAPEKPANEDQKSTKPGAQANYNKNRVPSTNNAQAQRSTPNTITGRVVDEKGQPIAGVETLLFRINRIDASRKLTAKTMTDAEGHYRFENVIDIAKEFPDGKLFPWNMLEEEFVQVIARSPGRVAGMQLDLRQRIASTGVEFDLQLLPGAQLSGRVTGPDDQPVVGALVSVGGASFATWDEIASARTKSDGTYAINDAAPYGMDEYRIKLADQNRHMEAFRATKANTFAVFVMAPLLTVAHPDFAIKTATYEKIPGAQDMKLEPAAAIEGRAVYGDSGKPAAGAVIHLAASPAKNAPPTLPPSTSPYRADLRADAEGRFRFANLPAGNYDLSAEMPDWVNVGIDAFPAASSKTSTVPNLTLTKGGVISICFIDDKTGKPIALTPDTHADISAHAFPLNTGISHPAWKPSAAANSAGRFELHAAPGKRAVMVSAVYVGEKLVWAAKPSPGELKLPVVELVEGKTVEVDIPVVARGEEEPVIETTGKFVPADDVDGSSKAESSSNRARGQNAAADSKP